MDLILGHPASCNESLKELTAAMLIKHDDDWNEGLEDFEPRNGCTARLVSIGVTIGMVTVETIVNVQSYLLPESYRLFML